MQNGPNVELPNEIWTEIASYLPMGNLFRLKEVCKETNDIVNTSFDILWQPFLVRLKAIDSTISISPPSESPPSDWRQKLFKENFNKINQAQMEELQKYKVELQNGDRLSLLTEQQKEALKNIQSAKRLETLEKMDILLNILHIKSAIDLNSNLLDLDDRGLGFIPEEIFAEEHLKEYWQQLQILKCCDNDLEKLPDSLKICVNLTDLWVARNKLTSLPGSIVEWTKLEALFCQTNEITSLPELVNCKNFKQLYCSTNKFTHLPSFLEHCESLEAVKCSHNFIKEISSILKQKLGDNLIAESNSLCEEDTNQKESSHKSSEFLTKIKMG